MTINTELLNEETLREIAVRTLNGNPDVLARLADARTRGPALIITYMPSDIQEKLMGNLPLILEVTGLSFEQLLDRVEQEIQTVIDLRGE